MGLLKDLRKRYYFARDYWEYRGRQREFAVEFPITRWFPCLNDRFIDSGSSSGAYFHQDLLIAQRIYQEKPEAHMDVGSRVDGFVAHVASFREIQVLDIRPTPSNVKNIHFVQADLMADCSHLHNSSTSISSLHAIEHFGLGRYGDPVRPDGHLLGLDNIYRILRNEGKFYFSVPIGPQRVEFNAHRVFSLQYLLNIFDKKYNIEHFSYVDDRGDLYLDIKLDEAAIRSNCGCHYGCGIFEMRKTQ